MIYGKVIYEKLEFGFGDQITYQEGTSKEITPR